MAYLTLAVSLDKKNIENKNIFKAIPNQEYLVYGAEIKDWLLISVFEWKNNLELLYVTIKDIYLNRWNIETDITLQDCIDFCSDVLISTLYSVSSGISDLNLVLKV